jgi:hypothetical protein
VTAHLHFMRRLRVSNNSFMVQIPSQLQNIRQPLDNLPSAMDRNEDNAQIDRKLDIQAWHHRIHKAGFPLHWCDACSASKPQKNSKTIEPETLLNPSRDGVSAQGVISRNPSSKACFTCANLDWDRYLYRIKDGLDTERRLEISSKLLQHSATSGRCTECLIIYSGIRNFAATLTNAEYRRRLFSFDRCYSVEIILRRNKCLRVLVHDTINERGPSQFVLADVSFEHLSAVPDGAGGPLIIELDYYGPSSEYVKSSRKPAVLLTCFI